MLAKHNPRSFQLKLTVVGYCCSAEVKYKKEVIPLAVKTSTFMEGRERLEQLAAWQEVDALKAAKGKAHIIHEVRARYHSVTAQGARIVTRSASFAKLLSMLLHSIHTV